ncbi:MAG: FAD-binding oxidoreductase [Alphaproteobacteria bacterium]|nr:FAD-binding oxidoreductase [Alphaproteobacteria bacterium]
MSKVIVIGAGVVGASAAYRLAAAGADVLVLEARRIGGGTSGVSFAYTNATHKPPRPYHDINVAGMRAHAALKDEFGSTPWWHGGGNVEWFLTADEQAEQRRNAERLTDWGYAVEWITPRELREMEPDIDPALIGDGPIAWYVEEGWLDPVVYAGHMMRAAMRHGAKVECGVRVVDVVLAGSRVTGVRTADGTVHGADVVVNCAGRWANDAVAAVGLQIPLAPTVGLLVFTPPTPSTLSRVLHSPHLQVRPDGAGRLMLHWGGADREMTPDTPATPTMPWAKEMLERARALLPVIGDVGVEAARITIRPIPGDGFSCIGPVPRNEGYYLAITHSGATMAPFLGACVADEIVGGKTRSELETVRPSRFFN